MNPDGQLVVSAMLLQELVAAVVPQQRGRTAKSYPVTLTYDPDERTLLLVEAKHALRGHTIPAKGYWPKRVQTDGCILRKVSKTYLEGMLVELVANADTLVLLYKVSRIVLPRIDAQGKAGIIERPPSPRPGHFGAVEMPPERPPSGRYEDDTWLFSARMPLPHHRSKMDQE